METIGCYVTSIVWKTLGVMLQVSYGKHWVLCYKYHTENIGCYVTSIIWKTLGVM